MHDDPPSKATPPPTVNSDGQAASGGGLESLRRTLSGGAPVSAPGSRSLHAPARDPFAPPPSQFGDDAAVARPETDPQLPESPPAGESGDTEPELESPAGREAISRAPTMAASSGTMAGLPTSLAAIEAVAPKRAPAPSAEAGGGTMTRLKSTRSGASDDDATTASGDTRAPHETGPGDGGSSDEDDLTGTLLSNRYRLEKRIGAGAMGAVYRATHTLIKKRYAIKILHPNIARDDEILARFQREAQAAAHIEHPNICAATDFGKTPEGMFFLVMEYLEGRALEAALEAEGRLAPLRVVHIIDQMASALMRAHALEIVHRDLKPDNVFLVEREGERDIVKIVDFGIARVYLEQGEGEADAAKLTQAGMVYGTPHYLSPEQAAGEPVTAQSDLYAVGIMMYEMLTGRRPFEGGLGQLLAMHMTRKPPPFAEAAPDLQLPESLERIVMGLLAKMPADRTVSAEVLRAQLAAVRAELGGSSDVQALASGAFTVTRSGDTPTAHGEQAARAKMVDFGAIAARARQLYERARPLLARLRPLLARALAHARPLAGRARAIGADLVVRGRRGEVPVLIGAGVALMLLVILLTVALLSGGDDEDGAETTASASAATSETSEQDGEPVLGPAPDLSAVNNMGMARLQIDPDIAEALELLDDGFHDAGLAKLERQRKRFKGDKDFLLLLANAYGKAGKNERSMEILGELIDQDPSWLEHDIVRTRVLEVFGQEKLSDARPAKDILMRHLPGPILDGLLAMAIEGPVGSRKNVRKRIEEVLSAHDALDEQPTWWQLTFELRLADRAGCFKRREIVQKLAALDDPRTLPTARLFHEDKRSNRCMTDELDTLVRQLERH